MAGIPAWLRRVKRCQYGIPGLSECGAFATTKRKRPSGRRTWDVCDKHAAIRNAALTRLFNEYGWSAEEIATQTRIRESTIRTVLFKRNEKTS